MHPTAQPDPPTSPPSRPRVAWVVALAFAALAAYLFRGFLLPVFLAVPLAYLLHPLTDRLEAMGIRRGVAVTCVFAALVSAAFLAGWLLVPRLHDEAVTLATTLPPLIEKGLARSLGEISTAYPGLGRLLPAVPQRDGWLLELLARRFANPAFFVSHLATIAVVTLLVPIIAFFLLKDAARAFNLLVNHLQAPHVETSLAVWWEIDRITGRYLRGIAMEAGVVGTMVALGLWAIGVPYPLLLGLLSAMVNPVPYLGAMLSLLTTCLVTLAAGKSGATVLSVVLLFVAIRILDDTVIVVLTVGASVRLHPVLVLASIIAGEQLLGLLGMVVAVPTVTVAKEVVRLLLEHRRTLAGLSQAELSPPETPSPLLC